MSGHQTPEEMQVRALASNPAFVQEFLHTLNTNPEYQSQLVSSNTNMSSSGSGGSNPRPAKPEKYDGNEKECLNHIAAMANYLQSATMTETSKIALAGSYLTGNAGTWFRTHFDVRKELCTFTSLQDYFNQLELECGPVNPTDNARDELDKWKQKTSVAAATSEFRDIMRRIPDMSVPDQIHRYLRGLKFNIQLELSKSTYRTLDEIIQVADNLDRTQFMINRRLNNRAPQGTSRNSASNSGVVPMDISSINIPNDTDVDTVDPSLTLNQVQLDRKYTGRLTPELRSLLMQEGRCFYCRLPGHTFSDCPRRPHLNVPRG